MDEQEKKALLDQINLMVKGLITDSLKDSVKKSDLESRVKDVNDAIEKLGGDNTALATLKDTVEKIQKEVQDAILEIKKVSEVKPEVQPKNFRQCIKDAIMEKKDLLLTEKTDSDGTRMSIKDYFTEAGNKQTPSLTLKIAVDMLESNIVQNNVSLLRLTELDPNRVGIPLAVYPNVLNYLPSKRLNRPNMSLMVVYSYEDGAETKTEGTASAKSSFLFKTVEFKSFTIATHFTLSDETLDDLEEALDEINIVAPDKIKEKLNSKVLGTTGNDSTDIAGLLVAGKHTDFVPATYAATIPKANIIDLIQCMKLSAKANKYMPNAVLMNPNDVALLAALKDQLDNSIMDRRVRFDAIGNPVAVCGLVIFESTAITADQVVVLDTRQTMIGIRKDMTMEIGYNGTDLTEGQKTVVIKMRAAFGVRDALGVIYSATATADTAAITAS